MNFWTDLTWLFEHRVPVDRWKVRTVDKAGCGDQQRVAKLGWFEIWDGAAGGGGLPALFHKSADSFQPENVLRNPGSFPAVTYLGSLKDFFFFFFL